MKKIINMLDYSLVYIHAIGFIAGTFSLDRIFQVQEYQESIFSPVLFQVRTIFAILFLSILSVFLIKDRTLLSRFSVKSPILIVLLVMIVGWVIVDFLAVSRFQFEQYISMIILLFYLSTLSIVLRGQNDIFIYLYLIVIVTFVVFIMTLYVGKFSVSSLQISPIGTSFTLSVLAAISTFISLWHLFKVPHRLVWRLFWFAIFCTLVIFGMATGARSFPLFLTFSTLARVMTESGVLGDLKVGGVSG